MKLVKVVESKKTGFSEASGRTVTMRRDCTLVVELEPGKPGRPKKGEGKS